MTDRSLIFSASMVRALLNGRKSMTRRITKIQLGFGQVARWEDMTPWRVGDRIWVREAWRTNREFDRVAPLDIPELADIWYDADHVLPYGAKSASGRARASIHLPRLHSRLTLTVTDVRVQLLQEISEADAHAEGMVRKGIAWGGSSVGSEASAKTAYAELWDSLRGPDAWSLNPWVAAISFTTMCRNIDEIANRSNP